MWTHCHLNSTVRWSRIELQAFLGPHRTILLLIQIWAVFTNLREDFLGVFVTLCLEDQAGQQGCYLCWLHAREDVTEHKLCDHQLVGSHTSRHIAFHLHCNSLLQVFARAMILFSKSYSLLINVRPMRVGQNIKCKWIIKKSRFTCIAVSEIVFSPDNFCEPFYTPAMLSNGNFLSFTPLDDFCWQLY